VKPILSSAAILVFYLAGAVPAASAELVLEDCRISAGQGFPGIKARCGFLERHENPADPASAVLALRVAVVPALSLEPEPDPFVPIAGGPGQSTIAFYSALSHAFEDIRRSRDIVLLDQRGTGSSAKLECDLGDEVVEGQLSTEETIALTRECLEAQPYNPEFFTTSIAVLDLEALRVALSYSQLNIYGVSYGTRVAQHFLRQFPGSVRSVILDGVVPPQLALGPDIAIDAQNALHNIFDRCTQSQECQARFPHIADEFASLEGRLTGGSISVALADPLTGVPDTIQFGHAELAAAIRLLSYDPRTVALMPLLIHEAVNENYAPLAAQFLMVMHNVSDSIAVGMHNAVVCTEDAPFYDGNSRSRDALTQTYIGPMLVEALEAICSVWPAGVIDPDFKKAVTTDKPVLLLSGDADPITPPQYADLAAVNFANKKHLTGLHQGHGQAGTGCMPKVMGRFIETLSVADEDLDPDKCLLRRHAMPFFLNFSGPRP
jgi:pimeloyl-ACP methyl ester carboxylesterase